MNPFTLAEWRRMMTMEYAAVRADVADLESTAMRFRETRDRLFREHPESPLAAERRRDWRGVDWYAYAPAWRLMGIVEPVAKPQTFEIPLEADGIVRCTRAGQVRFAVGRRQVRLAVYWLEGYGGGIWLPFADARRS